MGPDPKPSSSNRLVTSSGVPSRWPTIMYQSGLIWNIKFCALSETLEEPYWITYEPFLPDNVTEAHVNTLPTSARKYRKCPCSILKIWMTPTWINLLHNNITCQFLVSECPIISREFCLNLLGGRIKFKRHLRIKHWTNDTQLNPEH